MKLRLAVEHPWNVTPTEAAQIQRSLAALVSRRATPLEPKTIAAVDMCVRGNQVQAAVSVHAWPGLEPLAAAVWRGPVDWPYVPGLLSFRELPPLLRALEQLDALPDLILADGHGYAHPRRFGIACHLGVLLDAPVIGVAKSRLIGTHGPLAEVAGSQTALLDADEEIGAVVRTRTGVKPLYVSVGHHVDLARAVQWTLACVTRYRLPEPSRRAHLLSRGDVTGQCS